MICPWDGTEFIPKSSVHTYCSRSCRKRTIRAIKKYGDDWIDFVVNAKCKGCDRTISKPRLNVEYCSTRCSSRARRMIRKYGQPTPPGVKTKCLMCDRIFNKTKAIRKWCSKKCAKKASYIRAISGKEASDSYCSECHTLCKVKPAGSYPRTCSEECHKERTDRVKKQWAKKNRARINANNRQSYMVRAYIASARLTLQQKTKIWQRLLLARKMIMKVGVNKHNKKFWLDLAEIVQVSNRGVVNIATFVSVFNEVDIHSSILIKFSRWKTKILAYELGTLQEQDPTEHYKATASIVLFSQLCMDSSNTALGIPMV